MLLMRAQPVKIMRTKDLRARMGHTFVEDGFQSKRLIISECTRHIVSFCVTGHEAKVCFKRKAFFIHSGLELRIHSTDVHRVLDDFKIAMTPISETGMYKHMRSYLGARSLTGSTG